MTKESAGFWPAKMVTYILFHITYRRQQNHLVHQRWRYNS